MSKQVIYSSKCVRINKKWDENHIFKDNNSVFLELLLNDGSEIKICIDNFGWLQNYLFNNSNTKEYTSKQISNDIIGDTLLAVFNTDGEIECFGEDKESERMREILNY